MTIEEHEAGDLRIAEITSDKLVVTSVEDCLDLLGNLYYQGFDRIILDAENFDAIGSKSMKDFIYESNKLGHINFVSSTSEAIKRFSAKQ